MAPNMDFTPADAARTLADLPDYEESLTARASGITSMVWGLAAAAIFLTYGTADPYFAEIGVPWAYALLWVPWVAAGITASGAIWNSHAITLQRDPETKRSLLGSLGLTGAFLIIAATLFVGLDTIAGIEWSISGTMTTANGLFALVLGTLLRRWFGQICHQTPLIIAGTAMVAAGIAIGYCNWDPAATTLLGAGATGLAWFTAGTYTYTRG